MNDLSRYYFIVGLIAAVLLGASILGLKQGFQFALGYVSITATIVFAKYLDVGGKK